MCRSRAPASIASRSRWTASGKRTSRSRCPKCRRPRYSLRPRRPRLPVGSSQLLPLGAYVRLLVLLLSAVLALAFVLGGYLLFVAAKGRIADVSRGIAVTIDYVLPHFAC